MMRILLIPVLSVLTVTASAQQKIGVISLASHIRAAADGASASQCQVAVADTVVMLDDAASTDGYYHVRARNGCSGYVYRNRLRLRTGNLPTWAREVAAPDERQLKVCSFNIKWLGHYSRKDNVALARFLSRFDVVVVQELVASPISIISSSGMQVSADPESAAFAEAMRAQGFAYALGTDGTGQSATGTTAREWPIAFYRSDAVLYNASRSDFIEPQVLANPTFDRVPWAFHFTTIDSTLDMYLVSVHLAAEDKDKPQRRAELARIAQWGAAQPHEKDIIILGDMNLQDTTEVRSALPQGYSTLNSRGLATNCSIKAPKPFDQVMYVSAHSQRDLDPALPFVVTDLMQAMQPYWSDPATPYPGQPYDGNLFPQYYSDHHPVSFGLRYGLGDDD
jgi:endonuclease/exonuclease/phosphatase family metal-dependent hydrolase